jgi:cell division protease FtsH
MKLFLFLIFAIFSESFLIDQGRLSLTSPSIPLRSPSIPLRSPSISLLMNKKNYNPFAVNHYEQYIERRSLYNPINSTRSIFKELISQGIIDFPEEDSQIPEEDSQIPEEDSQIPTEDYEEKVPSFKMRPFARSFTQKKTKKSENFEITFPSNFTFKMIGGYEEIKEELSQVVSMMVNISEYTKYNVKMPRGLLLYGEPGTGKTMLAKAFAGESKMGFISTSGPQFVEQYTGVGAARIREMMKLAKENAPCIIFIDEFDAIARSRSDSTNSERDATLNQLLVEMDGFEDSGQIFFMVATNRLDILDQAAIRPGRIDKKIYIGLPDAETREKIIALHIEGKPHSFNSEVLVSRFEGLSGAQIFNCLNEAMLLAIRRDIHNAEMTLNDITFVWSKIIGGSSSNKNIYSFEEIYQIAIHEISHSVAGISCKHHRPFKNVVLNLNSPSVPGFATFEKISGLQTHREMYEHLVVLIAGRVGEEFFCHKTVTTGASNDLKVCYSDARLMITSYGFGSDLVLPGESEKYKEKIDDQIVTLINEAYLHALEIIHKHEKVIQKCANMLIEKGELIYSDIYSEMKDLNSE